jgi:RND family efflux transporter MFP subunit
MRFGRARRSVTAAGLVVLAGITACGPGAEAPDTPVTRVRGWTVEITDYAPSVSLTGEIRSRDQSDLSFRVGGRLTERNVDVGDHLIADQVLAKIDPAEQDANVSAALASVRAAEALLRQATATYERQTSLLDRGFTTRRDFEAAEEAWRTAQGSLDAAQAELAAAHEQRADTVLAAPVAGVITARHAEVGQVVQAAEPVFSIAHDGARDAVFQVHEVVLSQNIPDPPVTIALLSDPSVTATGRVREVAPIVDPASGTVRIKVGIENPPKAMTLGSAVVGSVSLLPRPRIALPWGALTAESGRPAVWIVDPKDRTVALRQIGVDSYDVGTIIVRDGLEPGETVVTAGAQLLRPEQRVALAETAE